MSLLTAARRYLENTRHLGVRSSYRMFLHDLAIHAPVRSPVMRLLPRYAQVEVTTVCNLRCTFCPRTTVMVPQKEKPVRHMRLPDFERVMEQMPFLWKVQLQGYGEPLLNPDILPIIRSARARGIAVQMNTNGTRWPKGGPAALIESGLTEIIFSIDGATPAVFEAGRVGARFEEVIGHLRELVETRRKMRRRLPVIQTATVVMPLNVHELPELLRLLREIGVDRCNFQLERSYRGNWVERAQAALAEAPSARGFRVDVSETGAARARKPPCPWPWRACYITVDGYVTACCEYPATVAAHHHFGNLFREPFLKIWNGPAYREFRRMLIGRIAPEVCVGCPAAP